MTVTFLLFLFCTCSLELFKINDKPKIIEVRKHPVGGSSFPRISVKSLSQLNKVNLEAELAPTLTQTLGRECGRRLSVSIDTRAMLATK